MLERIQSLLCCCLPRQNSEKVHDGVVSALSPVDSPFQVSPPGDGKSPSENDQKCLENEPPVSCNLPADYPNFVQLNEMMRNLSEHPIQQQTQAPLQLHNKKSVIAFNGLMKDTLVFPNIHADLELLISYLLASHQFTLDKRDLWTYFDTETHAIAKKENCTAQHIKNHRIVAIPNLGPTENYGSKSLIFLGNYCDRYKNNTEVVATLLHVKNISELSKLNNSLKRLNFTKLHHNFIDYDVLQMLGQRLHDCMRHETTLLVGPHDLHFLTHHKIQEKYFIPTWPFFLTGPRNDNAEIDINRLSSLATMLQTATQQKQMVLTYREGNVMFSHSTLRYPKNLTSLRRILNHDNPSILKNYSQILAFVRKNFPTEDEFIHEFSKETPQAENIRSALERLSTKLERHFLNELNESLVAIARDPRELEDEAIHGHLRENLCYRGPQSEAWQHDLNQIKNRPGIYVLGQGHEVLMRENKNGAKVLLLDPAASKAFGSRTPLYFGLCNKSTEADVFEIEGI